MVSTPDEGIMIEELDLLLVKPGSQKKLYGELSFSLSAIEPPLWAGLIAASIREHGYSVRMIDAIKVAVTMAENR